jgi:hypothetical protein
MEQNDRGQADRTEALYFRSPQMVTLAGACPSHLTPKAYLRLCRAKGYPIVNHAGGPSINRGGAPW